MKTDKGNTHHFISDCMKMDRQFNVKILFGSICVLSIFTIISLRNFTFTVGLMLCGCHCSLSLPRGAMGWSAARDCSISLSNLLWSTSNQTKVPTKILT